jgi:hypothetical protein
LDMPISQIVLQLSPVKYKGHPSLADRKRLCIWVYGA